MIAITSDNNNSPQQPPLFDSSLNDERIHRGLRKLVVSCKVLLVMLACGGPALTFAAEPVENTESRACIKCHTKADPAKMVGITRGVHGAQHIGCTHCHAPDPDKDSSKLPKHTGSIFLFRKDDVLNAEQQNAICVGCHDDSQRLHWQSSLHADSDLACIDCHSVHSADQVLDTSTEAEVCYRCHAAVRSHMLMPYSHPVRDGGMSCSDCHSAHGSAGTTQLTGLSVTESCTECHAEKRGPYLWEHAPVSEDCTLCHDPHGAIHPGMLTRRQPQLCQTCHQPSGEFAARHARRVLDYWPPGGSGDPADTNRMVLGESCLNCHSQVHGSNHPSGAGLVR